MNIDTPSTLTGKTSRIPFAVERWLSRDSTNGIILFLLAFLMRLPFQSQFLYHWDSVNFAYAMRAFNIARDQPQPPGYILYVVLARAIDLVFHDPQQTLVAISLVASSLSVVVMYLLGKEIFNRPTGWIAAGLLATSPLFWFYSEIALPHTLDTFLVLACLLWIYRVHRGDFRYIYPAVILLGIAGGIRQQTLVFLLPVALFAFYRIGLRRWIQAGFLGALVCLAWFIPLIYLSGGLANYLQITRVFSERFQDTTSIFLGAGIAGLIHNLRKLVEYTLYAWGPALVIPFGLIIAWLRSKTGRVIDGGRWIFLALWVSPALIFYTFIHMGQQGLIFVYLPALLIASAYGLERLLRNRPGTQKIAVGCLLAFNLVIFCILPEFPMGAGGIRILNRDTIVDTDRYYRDRIRAIRQEFQPESAIILAANWHHVEYYLPEYSKVEMNADVQGMVLQSPPVPQPGQPLDATLSEWSLAPDRNKMVDLVVFDPMMEDYIHSTTGFKRISLSGGNTLSYLELQPDYRMELGPGSIQLHP